MLLACVVVALIGLAFQFQAIFYSPSYAKKIAIEELDKYCKREHLKMLDFDGPYDVSVGGSPWAFEWKYRGDKNIIFGVWLHRSGHPEVYVGKD